MLEIRPIILPEYFLFQIIVPIFTISIKTTMNNRKLGPCFMKLQDVQKHYPGFDTNSRFGLTGSDDVFVRKSDVQSHVGDVQEFRELETIVVTYTPYAEEYRELAPIV